MKKDKLFPFSHLWLFYKWKKYSLLCYLEKKNKTGVELFLPHFCQFCAFFCIEKNEQRGEEEGRVSDEGKKVMKNASA